MNPIAKHYVRPRFKKRVKALERAGIPVTQNNVYDEDVEVGVPVPRFGAEKYSGRHQHNYAENRAVFVVEFVTTGVAAICRSLFRRRHKNVFEDHTKL
jgi:hypothetical protein